jgi:hypothetical protein
MKHLIGSILLIVTVLSAIVKSENFNNYFPMQVGNVWVYNCGASGTWCMCGTRVRLKIINTVVYNEKTYYQFQFNYSSYCGPFGCGHIYGGNYTIRIDTSKSNIYMYSPGSTCSYSPGELLLDSLKARLNDTIRYQCTPPQQFNTYKCTDTNNIVLFGVSRKAKQFGLQGFEGGFGNKFAYDIGLVQSTFYGMSCSDGKNLVGCIINGVLYGDTSMPVGAENISTEIADDFKLYQNYPNPFNPVTTLRFVIPATAGIHSDNIQLIIYNFIGQKIETLVNESSSPGTYEIEFDGTDYPSGVYFYKLIVGDYFDTKKMILLK